MARIFFRLSSNKDTRDILKNTRIGSYFYQSFNYILSNVNSSQAPSENKNSLEKSKQQIERKSNVLADSVHNVEKSFPEMREQQDRRKSNDLVVESVGQDEEIVEDISEEQDALSKDKSKCSGQI